MESDRIDIFIDTILKIAQGDLDIELTLSDKNDKLDALAMGINMLIDDLKKNDRLTRENRRIKALNEKLKEAQKKAEESDRLKTKFIQNISHEIRTPLNAIMGFSDLLPTYINDQESLFKFAEIITNSSTTLLQIINDLLDISKIESGQLSLNEGKYNLIDIFLELENFFNEYKSRIQKSHITISFEYSRESAERTFFFDQGKLKQILINLISNAIKYTAEGKIEVKFTYNKETQLLFGHIKDSGPGIPSDEHKSIFNRFIQSKNNNSNISTGTGLGLSIVKGLIELMKGNIWLESKINLGSTFHFSVPIRDVEI